MLKIAINFICKNEGHVIGRMLESVKPIIDLIIAVDTGSSDKTKEIIQEFGKRHSIPTFIFDRPFDNFANSRNHALSRLYETVESLKWDPTSVYGFSIDCDEALVITSEFNKQGLNMDAYVAIVRGESESFRRQIFIRLSNIFRWEGPIHEYIVWDDPAIVEGLVSGLYIYSRSEGASWKGDLEAKFMNYARSLTRYIEEGHSNFRWIFYTGESYISAAENCKDKERKMQLFKQAQVYYEKAIAVGPPTIDENIVVRRHLAEAKIETKEDWASIKKILLASYEYDPLRAEAIGRITAHYMSQGEWEIAYIYSKFSLQIHHGRNPCVSGNASQAEDSLYLWKVALYHYIICFYSHRNEEASRTYAELKRIVDENKQDIDYKDLIIIGANSPFYLRYRKLNPFVKQKFCPA